MAIKSDMNCVICNTVSEHKCAFCSEAHCTMHLCSTKLNGHACRSCGVLLREGLEQDLRALNEFLPPIPKMDFGAIGKHGKDASDYVTKLALEAGFKVVK